MSYKEEVLPLPLGFTSLAFVCLSLLYRSRHPQFLLAPRCCYHTRLLHLTIRSFGPLTHLPSHPTISYMAAQEISLLTPDMLRVAYTRWDR